MKYIDLRSDTVTEPTEEMREAMKNAPVGDDVYGDDPTVNLLEDKSASVLGKEAALFVPSGTFGNQLSILTHTLRGDEVLIPEENHIVIHEAGASAVIAGVQLRFVPARYGTVDPDGLEERIRVEDLHTPRTGLICMENAHSSGAVVPLANMEKIRAVSKKAGIPIHLDGARVFNAAAAMNCEPKDIARYADSVMFCLSKGLCAPAGSILAGSADFVRRARKNRKIMGGALRQAGVLAAPGIIALEKMSTRLTEDHQNAKVLASALSKIKGITVYTDQLDINMVFFSVATSETSLKASGLKTAIADLSHYLVGKFLEKGIKINGAEGSVFRFVTHYWIRSEHVRYVSECFEEILNAYYRTNA